ncbi:cyclic nucleotide-binding domain-containing protein [Thermospira aquatica]|uniref:Cyclic nucleotide-binding domain-containing protein n=1 Tax=Thermospira aquatica TaxID=2828656 RepID=A0AAX3BDS6_9SPIR|nr:cyclic nucleotide-binding domain-containing protein [Thermospira aquatica]URA10401.1 cyclic nucleotide-binding domain-containing protein [Thermospira aquatica]
MPVEKRFRAGSVIYFDHEVGDTLYILKAGEVELSFTEPETGEKIHKPVQIGEFFGLKSAIIGHTRGEVAEAITDSVTIEFRASEFETYVATNVELMKRLLRVFSGQLRNLGIKVNNYLGNNVLYAPNIGLFKIGEYYLNQKKYPQAIQVYQRYLKHYGNTNLAKEAEYRIQICQDAMKTGFLKSYQPLEKIMETTTVDSVNVSIQDTQTTLENTHSVLGTKEAMDLFYKGKSFCEGKDYANAEKTLRAFLEKNLTNVAPAMVLQGKLLLVTALFKQRKFNECAQSVNEFLKEIKDPPTVKQMLFVLADIYKELGQSSNEKTILQKIVMLAPIDDFSRAAKKRMEGL